MEILPQELVLKIFKHLHFKDLISCSLVNESWYQLSYDDLLWKKHCEAIWCKEDMSERTWYKTFKSVYQDFGRYIDIYADIFKAWKQIKSFMGKYLPHILDTLNPGITEENLDDLENKIEAPLPNDIRCIYRFHNGQKQSNSLESYGLFGTIKNYDYVREECFLPLEIHDMTKSPFLLTELTTNFEDFTMYAVIKSNINTLERGNVVVPCYDRFRKYFLAANSFMDYFCDYANNLDQNFFPIVDGAVYRFKNDPKVMFITRDVKITAATAFVPEMCTLTKFVHAYRITISMDKSAPNSSACQLETRHWEIIDQSGKREVVDGPGVIGQFPIIKPGTSYSYISCTNYSSCEGYMKGSYRMKLLKTGEIFDAFIPEFHMVAMPLIKVE